jgi:hypothetical protein
MTIIQNESVRFEILAKGPVGDVGSWDVAERTAPIDPYHNEAVTPLYERVRSFATRGEAMKLVRVCLEERLLSGWTYVSKDTRIPAPPEKNTELSEDALAVLSMRNHSVGVSEIVRRFRIWAHNFLDGPETINIEARYGITAYAEEIDWHGNHVRWVDTMRFEDAFNYRVWVQKMILYYHDKGFTVTHASAPAVTGMCQNPYGPQITLTDDNSVVNGFDPNHSQSVRVLPVDLRTEAARRISERIEGVHGRQSYNYDTNEVVHGPPVTEPAAEIGSRRNTAADFWRKPVP